MIATSLVLVDLNVVVPVKPARNLKQISAGTHLKSGHGRNLLMISSGFTAKQVLENRHS